MDHWEFHRWDLELRAFEFGSKIISLSYSDARNRLRKLDLGFHRKGSELEYLQWNTEDRYDTAMSWMDWDEERKWKQETGFENQTRTVRFCCWGESHLMIWAYWFHVSKQNHRSSNQSLFHSFSQSLLRLTVRRPFSIWKGFALENHHAHARHHLQWDYSFCVTGYPWCSVANR